MAMSQQNHLRLQVMNSIKHPEGYYQQSLYSKGINFQELTHDQICAYRATMDAIEADIRIEIAEISPLTKIDAIDLSLLLGQKPKQNTAEMITELEENLKLIEWIQDYIKSGNISLWSDKIQWLNEREANTRQLLKTIHTEQV